MGGVPHSFRSKFERFDQFIIFIAFIFFPLAIVLAAIRVLATQRHNHCRGRNNRLFGWVLAIAFAILELLMMIGSMEDPDGLLEASVVLGILLLTPAFILFAIARREDRKFTTLLHLYADAILRKKMFLINQIAHEVRQSVADAARDVSFMFQERMLPYGSLQQDRVHIPSLIDAPLDEGEVRGRRADRLNDTANRYAASAVPASAPAQQQDKAPQSVECPGCGARSVVISYEKKECEYCGTIIVA